MQPLGYRPDPKYVSLAPFFPRNQLAVFARARGYIDTARADALDPSAQNSKQLILLAATGDVDSLLVNFASWNPTFNAAATPSVDRRVTGNAGNLSNPTGLDAANVNALA